MQKQLPKLLQGFFMLALLLTATVSRGQAFTGTYTFTGTTGNVTSFAYNGTAITNLTPSAITKVGATTSSSSGNFRGTDWPTGASDGATNPSGTIDTGKYFQFTVTAGTGYIISNPSITFGVGRSATGPRKFEWRSSLDNYTSAIPVTTSHASVTNSSNVIITPDANSSYAGNVVSLTTSNRTTITFRLYIYGAESDSGSGGLQGALTFGGTLSLLASAPTISTTQVTATNTTTTTSVSGGNVTNAGTETVTARGVVWSTAVNPEITDINDFKTTESGTTGVFTSSLTGLSPNIRYYYRAYATNSVGTAYGTEYSFVTKANAPGAPIANPDNIAVNQLTVAINENSNNSAVVYSIRVNGTNYIQENGTVGSGEVLQTASAWGTKTVTGLSANTQYTFDSRARTISTGGGIGISTFTDYSSITTATTLPATSPMLTVGTTSLAFGNICINTTSTGSFTFTGSNISGNATLVISALSGYTYSISEAGTYTTTLTITNFTGASTTVYVHFTPTAVQSYNGAIHIEGQDNNSSAQLTVNTTAAGINTAGTVATGTTISSNITTVSAVLPGTATAGNCTAFSDYGFYYSTTTGFANGTGTPVTASNLSEGNFSATVNDLAPNTIYYYKAYSIDGAGIRYGTQQSFTTKSLTTAPVATAATAITQETFTANWNAITGATSYRLDVSTNPIFGTGSLATDLFFSEYVEGSSQNKYLEIYNGTGSTVNLSGYSVRLFTNGSTTATNTLNLTGTLAHGATLVIRNAQGTIYTTEEGSISHLVTSFNGDDAIALMKNTAYVDIIGQIGTDPGNAWTSGSISTLDMTLVRKPNITGGVTVNPTTGFPTLATEWDVLAIDNTNLGSHTYNFASYYLPGYENATINGTSANITGLDPYTNYYYRVRGYSANTTSPNSNTITVTTKPSTVTWTGSPAAWVPNVAPDATINAVVDANFTTGTNGAFTAKNLTLNSGKTFTITTGTTLTVQESIINNAEPGDFVVQNNAAILQGTDAENASDITVIKNSNALFRLDYTLWSSPVNGLSLGDFSPQTTVGRFYEYKYDFDATLGTNVEQYFIVPPTTLFEEAKAYLIRMPNGNLSVPGYNGGTASYSYIGTFTGTPHNGPVSKTASTQGDRYTAVGNPYPSPISVVDFFTTNSGVLNETSGLYFWRKRNGAGESSYATLTLAGYAASQENEGYIPNPVEGGDPIGQAAFYSGAESTWLISQGQGFIVKTKASPTTTDITFNNSMRRPAPASGNQAFFRTASSTRSRLWLNLTDSQQNFSQSTIAYMDNATTGIDYGYDGAMLNDGSRVALYSLAENTALAIQARPAFTTNDIVPMGFTTTTAGQFTISISHVDGLFEQGQDVYVKDNLLGTTTSLENDYTFTSEAGTFNGRFEIVYTASPALSTETPLLNANSVVVYKEGNAINVNAGTIQITAVTVYDINGRKLYSKNTDATSTTISNLQAAQQVLIIEINTTKGKVSKRIVF